MSVIRIGQIWKDNDPRVEDRKLMVIGMPNELYVELGNIKTKRKSTVQRERLRPGTRGYSLIESA